MIKIKHFVFVVFILLLAGVAFALTSGYYEYSPSAATGTNWTNPDSVYVIDTKYASYNGLVGTDNIFITGYGISLSPVVVIDSLLVYVKGYADGGNATKRTVDVSLTLNGTSESGDVVSYAMNTGDQVDTVRGSTDGLWNLTLTPSDVNSSNFGVTVNKQTTGNDNIFIDHVTVALFVTGVEARITIYPDSTGTVACSGFPSHCDWEMYPYDGPSPKATFEAIDDPWYAIDDGGSYMWYQASGGASNQIVFGVAPPDSATYKILSYDSLFVYSYIRARTNGDTGWVIIDWDSLGTWVRADSVYRANGGAENEGLFNVQKTKIQGTSLTKGMVDSLRMRVSRPSGSEGELIDITACGFELYCNREITPPTIAIVSPSAGDTAKGFADITPILSVKAAGAPVDSLQVNISWDSTTWYPLVWWWSDAPFVSGTDSADWAFSTPMPQVKDDSVWLQLDAGSGYEIGAAMADPLYVRITTDTLLHRRDTIFDVECNTLYETDTSTTVQKSGQLLRVRTGWYNSLLMADDDPTEVGDSVVSSGLWLPKVAYTPSAAVLFVYMIDSHLGPWEGDNVGMDSAGANWKYKSYLTPTDSLWTVRGGGDYDTTLWIDTLFVADRGTGVWQEASYILFSSALADSALAGAVFVINDAVGQVIGSSEISWGVEGIGSYPIHFVTVVAGGAVEAIENYRLYNGQLGDRQSLQGIGVR